MSAAITGQRPAVTLDDAYAVLFHFGDTNLGRQPGTFTSRLLATASAADPENLERLRTVYPTLIHAFECVARRPWGLEWLRGIVKDHLDGAEQALDFLAGDL